LPGWVGHEREGDLAGSCGLAHLIRAARDEIRAILKSVLRMKQVVAGLPDDYSVGFDIQMNVFDIARKVR
jgi:hypothetical protein